MKKRITPRPTRRMSAREKLLYRLGMAWAGIALLGVPEERR